MGIITATLLICEMEWNGLCSYTCGRIWWKIIYCLLPLCWYFFFFLVYAWNWIEIVFLLVSLCVWLFWLYENKIVKLTYYRWVCPVHKLMKSYFIHFAPHSDLSRYKNLRYFSVFFRHLVFLVKIITHLTYWRHIQILKFFKWD